MSDNGGKPKPNGEKPKPDFKSLIYFTIAGIFVVGVFFYYYFFILAPLGSLVGK